MSILHYVCNYLVTFWKGDWTQADLADKVGISRQAVISIEKYKYTPSLELAFKIAEVFGVSIDEVFEHREDK